MVENEVFVQGLQPERSIFGPFPAEHGLQDVLSRFTTFGVAHGVHGAPIGEYVAPWQGSQPVRFSFGFSPGEQGMHRVLSVLTTFGTSQATHVPEEPSLNVVPVQGMQVV